MLQSNLKNARILIVDDQQANVEVLEGLLEMQEYTNFKSTNDPRDVSHLYHSFNPDLILLDLMMPHLNGFEVMELLKSIVPKESYLPILVLTADITQEAKKRALSGGAMDFLVKPFDLIEVGLRIRNLLETRFLHLQYQNRNKILDEKVRERTEELERINHELLIANQKAEASNKLKTAFMHNISHEVRTPLNGILGFANLLVDPNISLNDKESFIPLLQASSDRLINTITDYMDISLIASGNIELHYEPVSVVAELEEIRGKFRPLCDARGVELHMEYPEGTQDLQITIDPDIFRKILHHLADNAVKFTHHGLVSISYSVRDGLLGLKVADTGVGIADDAKDKIFEVFMQEDVSNKRGHEGSGLGLSVIKGFLNLLGGDIHLESVKGKGSTFFVNLPLNPCQGKEPAMTGKTPAEPGNQRPVILVVDDEHSNLVFLEITLRKYASKLYSATNGREAVDICHEHPEISIILMDIKMPVLNGFEATREIRGFMPDVPIVAVTAYAMSGDEQRAMEAGCNSYLAKPVSKSKLLKVMQQHGLMVEDAN